MHAGFFLKEAFRSLSRNAAPSLAATITVDVTLHDERFTTRMAERFGGAGDEDSRAAAHLLEGWLTTQT